MNENVDIKAQKSLMTIKEIAEDLRSRGELDEGSLKKFNKSQRLTHLFFILVIMGFMLMIYENYFQTIRLRSLEGFMGIIGLNIFGFLYRAEIYRQRKMMRLYNYGISSYGAVKKVCNYNGLVKHKGHTFWLDYADNEGNKYLDMPCHISGQKNTNQLDQLVAQNTDVIKSIGREWFSIVGEELKILYNQFNSEEFILFQQNQVDKYNLRKDK